MHHKYTTNQFLIITWQLAFNHRFCQWFYCLVTFPGSTFHSAVGSGSGSAVCVFSIGSQAVDQPFVKCFWTCSVPFTTKLGF